MRTAETESKRLQTKTAQGAKVTMQHPTQANYLSTSFVAEAERAKTKEGVKSEHSIKRAQKQQVGQPNKGSKD